MMFRSVPTLSFEHIARAFAKESGSPCLQAMNVPPGARSFLVAALSRRLGRPILALSPSDAEAEEMFREISSYLGPEGACLFPSVAVAPSHKLSPPPAWADLAGRRPGRVVPRVRREDAADGRRRRVSDHHSLHPGDHPGGVPASGGCRIPRGKLRCPPAGGPVP